jgi:hypothetical protein
LSCVFPVLANISVTANNTAVIKTTTRMPFIIPPSFDLHARQIMI